MLSKSLRGILFFLISAALASCGNFPASTQTQPSVDKTYLQVNAADVLIGSIYEQPVDLSGKLYLSAWIDPDGTDFDQKIWDNFKFQTNETITEINWYGGYDPLKFGVGGPVLDFTIAIYPSIAAGTEPAVANPPLVTYQTGGNSGETSIGTVGVIPMYAYTFSLPASFNASAGVKYWVHIVASQGGGSPDWGVAAGTGGDGSHYRWGAGSGGDSGYRTVPGDAAFTLMGPVVDTPTPTATATATSTATSTSTSTNTPSPTATHTSTSTSTSTATFTSTPTSTSTATSTSTSTNTPTATSTSTFTNTPTPTATRTSTSTSTSTVTFTSTPTASPTVTFTSTPTSTPTPLPNTPGKVSGGGNMDLAGGKVTFGFVVKYLDGEAVPSGNLTFKDHGLNLSLKASSFTLLYINDNHARISGFASVNGASNISFTLDVYDYGEPGSADVFMIQIPVIDGYSAGGILNGGNITIH